MKFLNYDYHNYNYAIKQVRSLGIVVTLLSSDREFPGSIPRSAMGFFCSREFVRGIDFSSFIFSPCALFGGVIRILLITGHGGSTSCVLVPTCGPT